MAETFSTSATPPSATRRRPSKRAYLLITLFALLLVAVPIRLLVP